MDKHVSRDHFMRNTCDGKMDETAPRRIAIGSRTGIQSLSIDRSVCRVCHATPHKRTRRARMHFVPRIA